MRDVHRSAAWYHDIFGLQRRYADAWGDYPLVVGIGTTSLALFPLKGDTVLPLPPDRQVIAMRHLAFRVDAHNFDLAKRALEARGIAFTSQDHGISTSIYFPQILTATNSRSPRSLSAMERFGPPTLKLRRTGRLDSCRRFCRLRSYSWRSGVSGGSCDRQGNAIASRTARRVSRHGSPMRSSSAR